MPDLPEHTLDAILAIQLLVGWAGEGACEPPRLAWWQTDLVDDMGGGDLLKRLLPVTHRWAGLEAAREAGRRHSEAMRTQSANAARQRTLFHLSFEVDRQIEQRLRALKLSGETPAQALPLLDIVVPDAPFDAAKLAEALKLPEPPTTRTTPGGRRLTGDVPESPLDQIRNLAAALTTAGSFDDTFPQPHYEL